MSEIPPELLAEMTPPVRAFVESLMLQMAEMQARMQAEIDDLKAQVKKLTPKNSSVPPSTQHPHARITEKTKPKSKKKTRWPDGTQTHNSRTRPGRKMHGSCSVIPHSMPAVWSGPDRL